MSFADEPQQSEREQMRAKKRKRESNFVSDRLKESESWRDRAIETEREGRWGGGRG